MLFAVRHLRLILLAIGLFVSGCGAASNTYSGVVSSSGKEVVAARAPLPVLKVVSGLQRAYALSDWNTVRREVVDRAAATKLVNDMKDWHQQQVSGLRVILIHLHSISKRQFIGTVQFSADPRAIPIYALFVFTTHEKTVQITGTPIGLDGSSYLDAGWRVTRSQHFVVYHSPYQLAGSDRKFLQDLEHQRVSFERKFGVRLPQETAYYLYPRQDMMYPFTRGTANSCGSSPDNVGCTNPYLHPPSIQTNEWPSFHEPIHVYQLAIEPPARGKFDYVAPLFISEGMAVALEDRDADPNTSDYCSVLSYVPLDACARVSINGVKPASLLRDTGFNHSNAGDSYSLAGSFVKYLIVRFGYRPFARFYYLLAAQPSDSVSDYQVATSRVYHQSILTLLKDWQYQLCRPGCD